MDFGAAAIAIENKPWALDQQKQITDYLGQLESSHPNKHCLLYLSGDGSGPSEESIEEKLREEFIKDNRLLVASYSELIPWLQECESISQSARVRSFIDDFINYILQQFMEVKDMTEFDQICSSVMASKENLQMALKIARNINEIKCRLLEQLRIQLSELIRTKGWNLNWSDMEFGERDSFFRINFFEDPKYYLYFGFDGRECQDFFYGIGKTEESDDALDRVFDCLKSKFNRGDRDSWNVWWMSIDVPSKYQYWKSNDEPWIEILDNMKLATEIFERANEVYCVLANNNLLDSLK